MEKKLLLGDEAIALGALHAGLSGVYAYPGTPSTEITEFIQGNALAKERGLDIRDLDDAVLRDVEPRRLNVKEDDGALKFQFKFHVAVLTKSSWASAG